MTSMGLAWRQLKRDVVAGEVRILLAALVLSVMAVSSIGFLTDRAERALALQSNSLLGGDAVLRAEAPIPEDVQVSAKKLGLVTTQTLSFSSMLRVGETLRLGDVRALAPGFPLRGQMRIRDAQGEHAAQGIPEPGTAWLSQAGADALGASIGEQIGVGSLQLRVAALVTQEPDAALDMFNLAPRIFLNNSDVAATQLVQEGSRASYRYLVAGESGQVEQWVAGVRGQLQPGQRLESAREGRPEVRSALQRADRFLGLAALVSVILAAIAVAMAARRHSERHLSGAAILRCLGASQARLLAVYAGEVLMLGVLGSVIGVLLAYVLQAAVGAWLAQALQWSLPPASFLPAVEGIALGLCVLAAFALPPVLSLRRVSALRVLRRDLDAVEPSAWLVGLSGLSGLAALLWWTAGSATIGTAMLVGIGLTFAALAVLAGLLILALRQIRKHLRGSWRYGLANISRRPATSIAQVVALGLGVMALLLLGFVRSELLDRWRNALPKNAPDHFIANIQADQVPGLGEFFRQRGAAEPVVFPMVRARLIERNGKAVTTRTYAESNNGARRLSQREFNLSTTASLRSDNVIVDGTFWTEKQVAAPELSVEEELALTLGWKLGDRIVFDIAGQRLQAEITSLRKVTWDSFQPNFFVLVSPGALDGYAASYLTAAQWPDTPRFTADLLQAFPNFSVIDVQAVLDQVRSTMDQVSLVVEAVFLFSLIAGVLVLMAAVTASQDERLQEGGVMRVLGGSQRQLRLAQASEFAALGLLSGLTAAIAATVLAGVIAEQSLGLPWQANWPMALAGAVLGTFSALLAGLFATRRIVKIPPAIILREAM